MTTNDQECVRESDVLELVALEQWPDRADAALVAHVETCDVCHDLVAAAGAVVELRESRVAPVVVPDASVVWYRTQMRARADAARRAARPMLGAQLVALACLVAIGATWYGAGAVGFSAWWQWLTNLVPSPSMSAGDLAAMTRAGGRWIGIAVAACVVIGVLAFYISKVADLGERQHRI